MQGRLIGEITFTKDGKQRITIEVDEDFRDAFDRLNQNDIDVQIKKFSKKRSRDLNSYFWVLVGELSKAVKEPAIDIYKRAIKEKGVYRDWHNMTEKDIKTFNHAWSKMGMGWFTEKLDMEDDGTFILRSWYGTSSYTVDMFIPVLDWIKQDCEAVGINTATPDEEAEMISRWRGASAI